MFIHIKIFSTFVLIVALVTFGWPQTSIGNHNLVKGEDRAEDAARYDNSRSIPSPSLRNLNSLHSQPDSTEPVIFEEEEERNLVKEITVWVIGAAFVGYFIVKVFLEGESDENEDVKPKKEIPGGGINSSVPLFSF
jgi:hypothetical protein